MWLTVQSPKTWKHQSNRKLKKKKKFKKKNKIKIKKKNLKKKRKLNVQSQGIKYANVLNTQFAKINRNKVQLRETIKIEYHIFLNLVSKDQIQMLFLFISWEKSK